MKQKILNVLKIIGRAIIKIFASKNNDQEKNKNFFKHF